ncbi:uncharacterized protein BP5553_10012 [Venustampulla echinocandica]|uniref:Zn(2)-C6 fungal-type domain-containing protein n=1 Tax=Venustampulla echinocandica TaxID=2656787 RepID=A0A370TA23_9HELO|nr:uncharacterized protein BP5553_10012 [Venustampulla echinocandica]RDL30667.1 hypothetical protein BP5553_10012 [Venustampulla echinocandica]
MSKIQNTSRPRQPKLRASCDGCFLAKVKCSKDRPICSRCLTTGAECGYSPSCRTGKPKTTSLPTEQIHVRSDGSPQAPFSEIYEDSTTTYTSLNTEDAYSCDSPPYGIHPSWPVLQSEGSEGLQRQSVSSSTPSMVRDEGTPESGGGGANPESFDSPYLWNSSVRATPTSNQGFPPPPRSKSMVEVSMFPSLEPWFESQNEMFLFGPHSGVGSQKHIYMPTAVVDNSAICECFNILLQALQALHNHTNITTPSPSFDVVLTVNRRAVDGCAMMLDCGKCVNGGNSNTAMMLLATIIGKVMSFYRAASQNYFGFTPQSHYQPQPLPLTFGTYKIAEEDGRWLEMEILLRELRKLEGVLAKFQDVTKKDEMAELGGVQAAVIGYLRHSLSVIFGVLNMRRGVQHNSRV